MAAAIEARIKTRYLTEVRPALQRELGLGNVMEVPRLSKIVLNPRAFDGHGNYTLGLTEQLIFPEIDYDKIDTVRGMDVTIVTTATNDEHGRALLLALGFPFRRDNQ
mgnify:CR=1 FL=1